MKHKQFVLLSGGLDSSTILAHALKFYSINQTGADVKMQTPEAVSIDYGQRHKKEMDYARQIAAAMGAEYSVIDLPRSLLGGVMLTDGGQPIPDASYADLPVGISPTYVPNRNMTMISILVAKAQGWVMATQAEGNDTAKATVYIGAHSEDAANDAYPDCSPDFLQAMMRAVNIATYGTVFLEAPFMAKTKADIVSAGDHMGVPFELTWSCYKGEALHCGTCPTCRARKDAFIKAGVSDPTVYAVQAKKIPAEAG